MKLNSYLYGTALVLSLATTPSAWADVTAPDAAQLADDRAQVQTEVTAETQQQVADSKKLLIEEAVGALDQVKKAVSAIKDDDNQTAMDALALATGKLQTLVAREPDLALAPVDVQYVVYDVAGSAQDIRDIGNRIEDYVEDGDFQAARALLRGYASEIVIQTTNLPLATYPDAILQATALLDDGKADEALTVLDEALATQVVTETVIPLPTLRAEAMIGKAQELLNRDGADEAETPLVDDTDRSAADYVQAARQELELAEVLGYGRERDFRELHETLDQLDRQIRDKGETGGLFDKIAKQFTTLKNKILN